MTPSRERRRSRSRSPGPSLRPRRDYATLSSSSSSCASSAVYSRLSTRATAITAQPSAFRRYTSSQNFAGLPSTVSRPVPRPGGGNSNLAQVTVAPGCADQYSPDLSYLPGSSGSAPLEQSLYKGPGMFNQARDFTVTGTFVDGNITYHNSSSNQFMKDLLEETIRGAEFDSSDRDPPPRCQPGTRLAILERCLLFIFNCHGVQKMRWVVGAAGVGKSALMQSVAESPELSKCSPASVFFSINGRNDGTKAIITLSYQLATKSDTYRQIIKEEITHDPSLLRSSMAKQFKQLIVEPFIHNTKLESAGRVLVIIDGLDECKNHRTQLELLRLISDLCLAHPSSPLVWLIASRPEPHITSFFSKHKVIPAYEKEEIPIDSDEARADVESFLREELANIKEESDLLDPRWPEERDFWKVANAAGGLFAYAQTVINYIGDSQVGSPASQLSDVLHVIDKHGTADLAQGGHPMALLDALYERILSNVPDKIMINTRKLLLALAWSKDPTGYRDDKNMSFVVLCNWVGLTADEAYAALNHLRSVLYVPRRDRAHKEELRSFHKSFMDYISDFTRSGFSPNFVDEARQLETEYTFRILTEVPNGIQSGFLFIRFTCGILANGPVSRDRIPLTWPVGESGTSEEDDKTRSTVYKLAIDEVLRGMRTGDPNFQSEFCIRFLATVWSSYTFAFPYNELLSVVFDETRRPELIKHGILVQIPLKAIAVTGLHWQRDNELQFWCPAATVEDELAPQNPSCSVSELHAFAATRRINIVRHEWKAGKARGWKTMFGRCILCFERFEEQLEKRKADFPDDTALVMFTSTGECCAQVRFVYPEDGMSEWTYSFWCIIPQDVCEKYRSAV